MAKTIAEIVDWKAKEEAAIYSRRFSVIGEAHTQAEAELSGGMSPELSGVMSAEGKAAAKLRLAQRHAASIRQDARDDVLALEAAFAEMVAERLGEIRLELFKAASTAPTSEIAAAAALPEPRLQQAMQTSLDVGNIAAGDVLFAEAFSRDNDELVYFFAERRRALDEAWGELFDELAWAESLAAAFPDEGKTEAKFEQVFGAEPDSFEFMRSANTGS